jgi:hypothetical protein
MNDKASRPRRGRVCYYLQTHKNPMQIARLVRLIREASPDGIILIDHDAKVAPLDAGIFQSMPDVHVFNGRARYGDFSHVDRYFAAVDWLDDHGVAFDWFQNLSGQDYPIRPVSEIEDLLATTEHDGYLQYAPVFPKRTPPTADWGAGPEYNLCRPFDAAVRLEYKSRFFGSPTHTKQLLLRPFMIINWIQPWVRFSTAFGTAGVRRKSTVFGDGFICYGGSFFCALSAPCVRYARDFARENPDMVKFFRTVLGPDEIFLHSVLVNSGKFRFAPVGTHYVDWTNSHYNHPKILGVADLPVLLASDRLWARKFDTDVDAEVLQLLDRQIGRRSPEFDMPAETAR